MTVWPEDELRAGKPSTEDGSFAIQHQPEYYVLEMRRLDTGKFRTRVLVAKSLGASELPEEVLLRLEQMRQSIVKTQRSQRGRAAALSRADQEEADTPVI